MNELLRQFASQTAGSDGRNERVVGELVRAMAVLGCPATRFVIRDDRQVLRFRTVSHDRMTALHATIDRPTGHSVLSKALHGERVRLVLVAEQRLRLSRPRALLEAARRQQAGPGRTGDIRVQQDGASILARVELSLHQHATVLDSGDREEPLLDGLRQTLARLADALPPPVATEDGSAAR